MKTRILLVEGVHVLQLRPAQGQLSELLLDIPAGATITDVTDPAALRQMVGDMERERLRKVISSVVDQATNAEMCDSIYLTVFPDFHPLGSFTRIVYRVRPFVDDPNLYVHEGQPRPPTIPVEP